MSAPLKIRKVSFLRRRYIKGPILKGVESWSSWMDEAEILKEQILTDSTYQLIGDKVVLRVIEGSHEAQILYEVQGIPQLGLSHFDQEPTDILIYEFPEGPFEIDFASVRERARDLKRKIAHGLEESYDIVFEGRNLALHFFVQKDYIQSTHYD